MIPGMRVSLRPAVTLDGFIADLNGDCYSWINPRDEERFEAELLKSGCELVGRKTYEQYKDNYDTRTKVTTFVYTSKPQPDTDKVKFVTGKINDVLSLIEQKYGLPEVLVSGGGEMNGALAEANLIDDIYISYHPIILGEGIPLFGSYKPALKLELLSTDTEIAGIVRNHYKVIR